VRVGNERQRADLPLETFDAVGLTGELLAKKLHGDAFAEAEVTSSVDFPHAPTAKAMKNLIGSAED
jgi:hypothetical protein